MSEDNMKRNARLLANQGNRYAQVGVNGYFAHFVAESLLEKKGLLNPLNIYQLEKRSHV